MTSNENLIHIREMLVSRETPIPSNVVSQPISHPSRMNSLSTVNMHEEPNPMVSSMSIPVLPMIVPPLPPFDELVKEIEEAKKHGKREIFIWPPRNDYILKIIKRYFEALKHRRHTSYPPIIHGPVRPIIGFPPIMIPMMGGSLAPAPGAPETVSNTVASPATNQQGLAINSS